MRSWSQRNLVVCFCAMCLLLVGDSVAQQVSSAPSGDGQAAASATVPRLIQFSGTVKNAQGQPRSGVVGITFALYKDQEGGAALWLETQNVAADAQGQYVVLLGSTAVAGIPMDAFSANEARWLGVQPEGLPEQRVLLVSVPYALKAADAETLGGMPASSFVLAAPVAAAGSGSAGSQTAGSGANNVNPGAVPNTITGTTNYIPVYTSDAGDQGNSVLYQQPTTNYLGFQTTNPQYNFQLVVPGEDWLYGGFSIVPAFSGGTNWNTLYGNGGSGFSLIGTAKNMGYPASRLDMGANATINFQTGNGSAVPTSRMFVTAAGNVGIGTVAPAANLEIAGTVGLLVDSPGTITGTIVGNGSGLTSLPAASLTGTLPTAALSGANGSGLTSLNAASLTTGTLPSAALPANVALQNASNTFSAANTFTAPQTINTVGMGPALTVNSTGAVGSGLSASSNDPNGFGAVITNSAAPSASGGAYILELVDSTGTHGLRVNANGLELNVPFAEQIPNDATGTTLNTLVRYTNSGTVATVPTSGSFAATGVVGVVVAGAGNSGNADVAFTGITNCVFDNATSVGDYVVSSQTATSSTPTAGDCHDYGNASGLPRYPLSGVQIVGRVLAANPTPGTPTQIYMYGYETRAIGSVNSLSLTDETAAIAATPLFTPLVSGLFRVNVYMATTAGTFTGGAIAAVITWEDEGGARQQNNIQLTGLGFAQGSVLLHAISGQAIQFSTTDTATGPPTYEAFVTLDRLQ